MGHALGRHRQRAGMMRAWKYVLAWLHISDAAVCEMSKLRGPYDDFHDWRDGDNPPWHLSEHECRRCGKTFYI
jgi:hypothetical protein